jgi:hypothetical protein
MDFEDAISQAFGGPSGSPKPEEPTASHPPIGSGVDPFENDFHGVPKSPPRSPPRGGIKKRERGAAPPKGDRPKERKEKAPKKPKPADPATKKEQKEKYEQIMRYVDTFPEHINGQEMMGIGPDAPVEHLTFVLQRIQQRINARQELQVLQSGLVTMCMAAEFGCTFVPNNPVKLHGFGSNVSANINLFDDCLKQIACKYGGALQLSVESQIGIMLVRCAVNTHVANLALESEEKLDLSHMGFPEDVLNGDDIKLPDTGTLPGHMDADSGVPV